MSNNLRNVLIVVIIACGTVFASAQTTSPLDAVVQAIDGNTRAQIRTCEAMWGRRLPYGTVGNTVEEWRSARRCWQ